MEARRGFRAAIAAIRRWNLHKDRTDLVENEQLLATRINVIVFIIVLLMLIILRTFTPQTIQGKIDSPTFDDFQRLVADFPSTYSCPCTEIFQSYGHFLSINIDYHQLCSSDFISPEWISSLFLMNSSRYHPFDFRSIGSSQFQIIALLCRSTQKIMSNRLKQFAFEKLINSHAVSSELLRLDIDSIIDALKLSIRSDMMRVHNFIELTVSKNRLESALRTNYLVFSVPGERSYLTNVAEYLLSADENNGTNAQFCSCDFSFHCRYPSAFYERFNKTRDQLRPPSDSLFRIVDLYVGCTPSSSILQSALTCLHNRSCINGIQGFFHENAVQNRVQPLNSSLSSRFSANTSIQKLFEELFIENLIYRIDNEEYFQNCAPSICFYTYSDQSNFRLMLSTLISLMGGLIVMIRLFSYLFVLHIYRRVSMILCRTDEIVQESIEQQHQTLREKLVNRIKTVRDLLVQLNFFQTSPIVSDLRQKQWATRFFLFCLLLGFTILTIYSTIIEREIITAIESPTNEIFEHLYQHYPWTLSCPCSTLSISYADFIDIEPSFHQICSSDFVDDNKFLTYFNMRRRIENGSIIHLHSQDFRYGIGLATFRLLQYLCVFTQQNVEDALNSFRSLKLVTNQPLSSTIFYQTVNSLTERFQKQTQNSFLALLSLITKIIEDNHFHVASDSNIAHRSYFINDSWIVKLKPRLHRNTPIGNCTCLLYSDCLRHQGFYCFDTRCISINSPPNQTIPGLNLGCFPLNSLFLSTLECFYDQACVQMLLDWRLFEVEHVFYPINLTLTALNQSIPSRYAPATSIYSIVAHMFIEEWNVTGYPNRHYQICQPQYCSYTWSGRFDLISIITYVLGLLGGLSVMLKIFTPIIVRGFFQLFKTKVRVSIEQPTDVSITAPTATMPSTSPSRSKLNLLRIYNLMKRIDFFENEVHHSKSATRCYFFCFVLAFVVIFAYTSLYQRTMIQTIQYPSETTFYSYYKTIESNKFICQCSRTSILYRTFLDVHVRYHEVCSSYFVSKAWALLIGRRGDELISLYDQPLLGNYFRMLSSLCTLVEQTIVNAIDTLTTESLISIQVINPDDFQNRIKAMMNSFIEQTPSFLLNAFEYLIGMLRSNQFEHLFLSNWNIRFSTGEENYILATDPVVYNNGTCICATSMNRSCWWPLKFVLPDQVEIHLPGLKGGCLPIDGLMQSTLECLYEASCLNMIRLLINITRDPFIPDPLNASAITRFPIYNTTISSMIEQLFVEEWTYRANYSSYYQACAPRYCSYSSNDQKRAIYLVTVFLGLYGGITLFLRIFILFLFKTVDFIQHHAHA